MWTQARGMDEGAAQGFLDRFVPGGAGVGFAVLGGSFGEGIDLRGDRLVGAFVATLGLPQVNPRNEQLKACLKACSAPATTTPTCTPASRRWCRRRAA
jgi:DNA excision repair protein ERCC-2